MTDDLISRQAAIDEFGLSEKTRKYGGDHSGYGTMMLYEIQDTLESLPSAQQWIPCSERLPEAGEYVLRTIRKFGWHGEEYWSVDIGPYNTNDGSIIAWMPLPEPYRGEES